MPKKSKKKEELFKLDMTFEEAVKLALNTPPLKKKDKKNATLPKLAGPKKDVKKKD